MTPSNIECVIALILFSTIFAAAFAVVCTIVKAKFRKAVRNFNMYLDRKCDTHCDDDRWFY